MSHKPSLSKKLLLALYVGFWGVLLAIAAVWLTKFLVGTLGDPLAGRDTQVAQMEIFDSVVALTEKKIVRYLGEWELLEPRLPGHFHHIGRWYEADKYNFCIKCHGQTPHSNSPQVRAFLNMHNLFISCQVCHVREKETLRLLVSHGRTSPTGSCAQARICRNSSGASTARRSSR